MHSTQLTAMRQKVLRKVKGWFYKSDKCDHAGNCQEMKEHLRSFANWLEGIPEEIRFWHHYLGAKGGDFGDDFAFRMRHDTKIAERDDTLANTLTALGLAEVRLLDAGSGPLTNLGKALSGVKVEIVPCDPLADVYGWLYDKFDVTPPVRTRFADVENLSMYFGRDTFDAVHCANALDHSYNPLGGIFEMLKVTHPRGFVQLGHWENEAVHEKYIGLHQWNFTERDGDFVMWNRTSEVALRGRYGDALDVQVRRIPVPDNGRDWILVQVRKTPKTEELLAKSPTNLLEKYLFLVSKIAKDDAQVDFGGNNALLAERYHSLLRTLLKEQFDVVDSGK